MTSFDTYDKPTLDTKFGGKLGTTDTAAQAAALTAAAQSNLAKTMSNSSVTDLTLLFSNKATSEEIEIDNLLNNSALEKSIKVCAGAYAGVPIGPVSRAKRVTVTGGVNLFWSDPSDLYISGNVVAAWEKTVIVRNDDHAPTSISDGTVVCTNTVRNQYASSAYLDADGTDASNYRAFPYSESGYMNRSEDNIFSGYTLFGFEIDESNSSPTEAVTYTDENAEYDHIRMSGGSIAGTEDWMEAFFMPKPCMLHHADADHAESYVDYYLDPDDYTKRSADDPTDPSGASDVANTDYDGNAMMEWPPVYMKVGKSGDKITFKICDIKLDDSYEAWSAKREDGTYANWYSPIYEGSIINSVMRSISTGSTPTNSTTATTELTAAQSNNLKDDKGYAPTLWADEQIIMVLAWMVTKSLNIQSALGYNGTASSLQLACGAGNTYGMFYGKSDGSITTTKLFGMENWWGHRWRRCQGIVASDYSILVKMTLSNVDGTTGDLSASDSASAYSGYIATGNTIPSGANQSYITKMNSGALTVGMASTASGGSSETYYCDAVWSASGLRGVCFGDRVGNGSLSGLSACGANNAPSYVFWAYGASLSYHHF